MREELKVIRQGHHSTDSIIDEKRMLRYDSIDLT